MKVKVVDAAGANLAGTDAVAPTNLFLHSLFANVSINLCGKKITEKDSLYPYRAYLETLLSYNQNVLETRGVGKGWHKDKNDLMNSVALAVQQGQPDPNPGWIERRKTILQSRTVTLIGRPHLDMFHQNLDLPPGCPMTIRFTPPTSALAFIGAIAHLAVKVTLVQATFYVRTKRV